MSKRVFNNVDKELYPASKKIKTNSKTHNSSVSQIQEDWGDDIDEINDIIFTQSYPQDQQANEKPNIQVASVQNQLFSKGSNATNNTNPSNSNPCRPTTSHNFPNPKTYQNSNGNAASSSHNSWGRQNSWNDKKPLTKMKSDEMFGHQKFQNGVSQILAGSEIKSENILSVGLTYQNFKQMDKFNSTLISQKNVGAVDIEIVKKENTNLKKELTTKNGEIENLRRLLETTESRLKTSISARSELVQKQKNEHQQEIENMKKIIQELKDQHALESLNAYKQSCKVKESTHVKLTQPKAAVPEFSQRTKLNSTRNEARSSSSDSKNFSNLNSKICLEKVRLNHIQNLQPLSRLLPESVFKKSVPEKPVVAMKRTQGKYRRKFHILDDVENHRIFENPDLKPIETFVGNQKLDLQIHLQDLTSNLKKSDQELEAKSTYPFINKFIASTRELILNTTIVLEKISNVMVNDDIKEMCDIYSSPIYEMPIYLSKNVCDGDPWYEEERGIEARRFLGIVSYLASNSTYLSEYISGKIHLETSNDVEYKTHIAHMTSYASWSHKEQPYEFLKLLSQFVTVVCQIRRVFQFSGLINAIMMTLSNARNKVAFDATGTLHAFSIVKGIVLSKPLLNCIIPVTKTINAFSTDFNFLQELLLKDNSVENLAGIRETLYFKPGSSVLEDYLNQVDSSTFDSATTVVMMDNLIPIFYRILFPSEENPNRTTAMPKCELEGRLVRLVLKLLSKCLSLDFVELRKNIEKPSKKCRHSFDNDDPILEDYKNLSQDFWETMEQQLVKVVKKGTHFMNNALMTIPKCEPSTSHLVKFLEQANAYKSLRQIEKEAVFEIEETRKKRLVQDTLYENDSLLEPVFY